MTVTNETALSSIQYWVLTGIGVLALVLVILNIVTAMTNADLRKEVNERQQYINQSVKLSRLHNQLVQGLAKLAAQSGDEALRAVLAKHGIRFSVQGQGAEAALDQGGTTQAPVGLGQGGRAE